MTATTIRRRVLRRVPFRQQMTSTECGAACLAMALSFHGRSTSVSECRRVLGPGRDGLSAQRLADVGRQFGLKGHGLRVEANRIGEISRGSMLHWGQDHFVVFDGADSRRVHLLDPAVGRRCFAHAEFAEEFRGVVVQWTPQPGLERRRSRPREERHYLRILGKTPGLRGLVAKVIGLSVALQIGGLITPIMTKLVVDNVVPSGSREALNAIGIGLIGLVATVTAVTLLRGFVSLHLRERLDDHVMHAVVRHFLRLPYRFFQTMSRGDLLTRINSTASLRDLLTSQSMMALIDGLLVVGYVTLILLISPSFGLIVVLLAAVQLSILVGSLGRTLSLAHSTLAARAEEQNQLVEALTGVEIVKAGGLEDVTFDRWSGLFRHHLERSILQQRFNILVNGGLGLIRTGAPVLLLWIGSLFVLNGDLTLGSMLALTGLASAALMPLASVVTTLHRLQSARSHLERLGDVLGEEPESDGRRTPPSFRGEVRAHRVGFRYAPATAEVLSRISIELQAGRSLGIVGPTGSGKSTLGAILTGLHQPSSGDLTFDGIPGDEIDLSAFRRSTGVVMQTSSLFNGSIRDNVARGCADADDDDIIAAARIAALHRDVARMPLGYDTRVGDGGRNVSGGQMQRIALARAVIRQPSLLLLDEATSNVDPATEREILTNLATLSMTKIIIAHRASALLDVDQIIVLREGTIVQSGSPADLRRAPGFFREMLASSMVSTAPDPHTDQASQALTHAG